MRTTLRAVNVSTADEVLVLAAAQVDVGAASWTADMNKNGPLTEHIRRAILALLGTVVLVPRRTDGRP